MGTLNNNKPAKTTAEQLDDVLRLLAETERRGLNAIKSTREVGHDLIWDHPTLTPQKIFDRLGTSAWKVIADDIEVTDFLDRRTLRADGTPDPELAPFRITVGVPGTYVLTPVQDGVVTENNPKGFGSVLARPKLYVLAPAGAAVTIRGETATAAPVDGKEIVAATFVLPEGEYAGTAELEGYEDGKFTVTLTRGGQQVKSGLVPIPQPPIEEPLDEEPLAQE